MRQTKAPIIGVTTYGRNQAGEFSVPSTYMDAILAAGGVPLLIPPTLADPVRILDAIDGLVLTGGGDIDPALYGGASHPTVYAIDAERDAAEIALAKQALSTPIATLGICRGMQVLGVAGGADLIAHVPDVYGETVLHRLDNPRRAIPHAVTIKAHTRLAAIVGEAEIEVVSWHHQAIKTVPPGWHVSAQAADGLIEALEYQPHPWLVAVQWHPELSPTAVPHQRLFQALVEAARYSRTQAC